MEEVGGKVEGKANAEEREERRGHRVGKGVDGRLSQMLTLHKVESHAV